MLTTFNQYFLELANDHTELILCLIITYFTCDTSIRGRYIPVGVDIVFSPAVSGCSSVITRCSLDIDILWLNSCRNGSSVGLREEYGSSRNEFSVDHVDEENVLTIYQSKLKGPVANL